MQTITTTTTTTVLRPFVRDYSGEPVTEGYTILDFTEAEMMRWQWHQLDHTQVTCTSLQTDNHASTLITLFFTDWTGGGCSSCHPIDSVKALKAQMQMITTTRQIHTSLTTFLQCSETMV